MSYLLHLAIFLSIYAILSLSMNLVVGYHGLLPLSHSSFFAIGAYATALSTVVLGIGFLPAVLIAVCTCVLFSLVVSLPAWNYGGDFFVLISLAVQVVLFSVFRNWGSVKAPLGSLFNMTNGTFGISGVPRPTFFGTEVAPLWAMALIAIAVVTLVALLVWALGASPWGRLLKCARDDELVIRGLGKRTHLMKLQSFAVSCALAGLAGAVYVSYVGYIDPSIGSLDHSILILSMVLVGGAGNFVGPLIGASILVLLPEFLRAFRLPDTTAANIRLILFGLLLILLMRFRPQGVAGEYRVD